MNTAVLKDKLGNFFPHLRPKWLALIFCGGLLLYSPTREIMLTALAEAYYQVSVFVAVTLFGLLLIEKTQRQELATLLSQNQNAQVLFATICGAIPGCGGAIFVVTQYVRGAVSFGSVVATLTATMGDAAFLLLAKAPTTALIIFAVCFVAGVIFGYIIDAIHGRDFLRCTGNSKATFDDNIKEIPLLTPVYFFWLMLFFPGALIGIGYAFQYDVAELLSYQNIDWVSPFGAAAALLAVLMWVINPLSDMRLCMSVKRSLTRRAADTTNFVTFWVLCGFVGYALLESFFEFDLTTMFGAWLALTPLVATLIGFIPGCGPQIVVTTLYLNGAIPLSAQLANAISNDGDALFPALALAPKASIVATLYTAIPALLVGYTYFLLFE